MGNHGNGGMEYTNKPQGGMAVRRQEKFEGKFTNDHFRQQVNPNALNRFHN